MRLIWLFALVGCADSSRSPSRDREILVDGIPGGVVIYQDGDEPWQLAPRVGQRFGFDVAAERYAVAVIDPDRHRVDALYTTPAEHTDIRWLTADRFDVPRHLISGTVTGILERGFVASSLESRDLGNGESFMLAAAEGSNTIVAGRTEGVFDVASSLIVHRDVPVVADLPLDADFSLEGLPTGSTQLLLQSAVGCVQRTMFSFGGTTVQLGSVPRFVIFPNQAQWQATDHMTLEFDCDRVGSFRRVSHDVAAPGFVPTELIIPPLSFGEIKLKQGRLEMSWIPYLQSVEFYEGTVGTAACSQCARWTTRITEGWNGSGNSFAVVLSPPDLEPLGLRDPRLELSAEPAYEVSAFFDDERTRNVVGMRGRAEVVP